MKKLVALFDMDGSLFDYDGSMSKSLNELKAPEEPNYQGSFHDFEKIPHLNARIKLIRSVPGWWRNLAPLPNGFKVYELAKKMGFDCHILTKGPRQHPLSWAEKLECCQHHFGSDIKVHITQNKGLVYGKVLYDDFIPYMKQWLEYRPRGLGIMPVTESNKKWGHKQVIKWNGEDNIFENIKNQFEKILGATHV